MSVPLGRLYNFLQDVASRDDIIIYRFFPNGSRKIADLLPIDISKARPADLIGITTKLVICNDQEPLNFDLYSSISMVDELRIARASHFDDYTEDQFRRHRELVNRVIDRLNFKIAAGVFLWDIPFLLVHSEKRSKNLARYEQIKGIGVYWWTHALVALEWFRYAELDPALGKHTATHDFLIYNRAWSGTREYRIKFAELLIKHNLVDCCRTWFSEQDHGHYTQHQFKNTKFAIQDTALEKVFSSSVADSDASAEYCVDDYVSTQIEVVLETLFDDDRLHLTEKSLRPIACGHPFILAATPGSLEYLRDYGFETFHGLIDESYDTIQDPLERLQSICAEMKRITELPQEQKSQLFEKLRIIAGRNKKLFFSTEWQQKIVNEFKTNFDCAVQQLETAIKS